MVQTFALKVQHSKWQRDLGFGSQFYGFIPLDPTQRHSWFEVFVCIYWWWTFWVWKFVSQSAKFQIFDDQLCKVWRTIRVYFGITCPCLDASNSNHSLRAGSHLGAHALGAKSEFKSEATLETGFVGVLENLESPGILFWHFPGLESPW